MVIPQGGQQHSFGGGIGQPSSNDLAILDPNKAIKDAPPTLSAFVDSVSGESLRMVWFGVLLYGPVWYAVACCGR